MLALSGWAARPRRPRRAGAALLAHRERMGRGAHRTARPAHLALRRARSRAPDRLPLARGRPVALDLGGFNWSRSTRASATRTPRPATTPVEPSRTRPPACWGSRACATRRCRWQASLPEPLGDRVRHVVTENERVDPGGRGAQEPGTSRGSGRTASTPRTRASATATRSRHPAIEATVVRLRRAGTIGARLVGGGFGGHVLGLLPPDVSVPEGAIEVRPGPGARVELFSRPIRRRSRTGWAPPRRGPRRTCPRWSRSRRPAPRHESARRALWRCPRPGRRPARTSRGARS